MCVCVCVCARACVYVCVCVCVCKKEREREGVREREGMGMERGESCREGVGRLGGGVVYVFRVEWGRGRETWRTVYLRRSSSRHHSV